MECPVSTERLHELHVVERFTPAQIITLTKALTGQTVDEAQVLEWFAAAGIGVRPEPGTIKPKTASPARQALQRAKRGPQLVDCTCATCGAEFQRRRDHVRSELAYCNPACYGLWIRGVKGIERRARRQAAEAAIKSPAGEKACAKCGIRLPLSAYTIDRFRPDGHSRICRSCNAEKTRAYMEAHADELREKKRARRQAARAQRASEK